MKINFEKKLFNNKKYDFFDLWINYVSIDNVEYINILRAYIRRYDTISFLTKYGLEHHIKRENIISAYATFYNEDGTVISNDEENISEIIRNLNG